MTKKKLNIDSITNELEGASLFFTRQAAPPPSPTPIHEPEPIKLPPVVDVEPGEVEPVRVPEPVKDTTEKIVAPEKPSKPKKVKRENKDNSDTVIPRYHDTTVSRYQDTTTPEIHGVQVDQIRKAVKEFGKEAATHRFTVAEKKEIADLIYTYKNRGIKTSENEIARISVNFIVEDFKVNGENSVLHKILKALSE
jgi:outer membrane biosynthesis protein TonB